MPIDFACACGKRFSVGDEHAGKKTKCRNCGTTLQVPFHAREAATVSSPIQICNPSLAKVGPVPNAEQMARIGSGTGLLAPVQDFWILGTETGHPVELYVTSDKLIIKYVFSAIWVFLSVFVWVFWVGHFLRSRKYPDGREIPRCEIREIEVKHCRFKAVKTAKNPKTRIRYIVKIQMVNGSDVTLALPLTNPELHNFQSLSWVKEVIRGP